MQLEFFHSQNYFDCNLVLDASSLKSSVLIFFPEKFKFCLKGGRHKFFPWVTDIKHDRHDDGGRGFQVEPQEPRDQDEKRGEDPRAPRHTGHHSGVLQVSTEKEGDLSARTIDELFIIPSLMSQCQSCRAGHLQYFFKFSLMKTEIFFIFYEINLTGGRLFK